MRLRQISLGVALLQCVSTLIMHRIRGQVLHTVLHFPLGNCNCHWPNATEPTWKGKGQRAAEYKLWWACSCTLKKLTMMDIPHFLFDLSNPLASWARHFWKSFLGKCCLAAKRRLTSDLHGPPYTPTNHPPTNFRFSAFPSPGKS